MKYAKEAAVFFLLIVCAIAAFSKLAFHCGVAYAIREMEVSSDGGMIMIGLAGHEYLHFEEDWL